MQTIRIHGDTHNNIANYIGGVNSNTVGKTLLSNLSEGPNIHLGDVGFNYCGLEGIPITQLAVILGNHDNYDTMCWHSLGNFGLRAFGGMSFFFVRGEFSIDYSKRESYGPDKTWWWQEELSDQEMAGCLYEYGRIKPNIVLTHGAPAFLQSRLLAAKNHTTIFPASRTMKLLEMMWTLHAPTYWYFGHWHTNTIMEIGPTQFVCIDELCYVDINPDGSIINGPC